MKRRTAVKQLFVVGTAIWFFPSCAGGDKKNERYASFLNKKQMNLLSDVVDTILPSSDTPGAVELGVPFFIERYIRECRAPEFQQEFKSGLDAFPAFVQETAGEAWKDMSAEKKLAAVVSATQNRNNGKSFKNTINSIRELTINGYTNSEYYLTKIVPYELVPGRFTGCTKLTENRKAV